MTPFSANSTMGGKRTCQRNIDRECTWPSPWPSPNRRSPVAILYALTDQRTRGLFYTAATEHHRTPVAASTASTFYPSAGPASGVVVAAPLLLGCRHTPACVHSYSTRGASSLLFVCCLRLQVACTYQALLVLLAT